MSRKVREAWPSIKTLSNSPDKPVECARLPSEGKMMRMAALQKAISRADSVARVAALSTTLEAYLRGAAERLKDHAFAGLSGLRSCYGALAPAWLTPIPGFTERAAIEFCHTVPALDCVSARTSWPAKMWTLHAFAGC